MSNNESAFGVMYRKFKPHLIMVLVQVAFAFLYFLVEASLNKGMNPHVFVTYRHALGGLVMLPFAYVCERKILAKLTMKMFVELFVLSLFGISLTLNIFFASLKYATPSFVSSMINTISSLTFIIAVGLRLEAIDVKQPRGMAKICGALLSLIGGLIMTLYEGHTIQSLQGAPFHIRGKLVRNNRIKGSILTVASCISWSLWYILQAIIVKKYSAQLMLTAWINCMGAAQSAVFTVVVMQHKPEAWFITSTVELCCILYAGVICGGLVIYSQFWTTEQKGPVFVTMFNPLGTILVAILAYFVFGDQLHTGSLIGVSVVIIGLNLLLWGKESDRDFKSQQSSPTHVEQKECMTQIKIAAEQEEPQRNVTQDTN